MAGDGRLNRPESSVSQNYVTEKIKNLFLPGKDKRSNDAKTTYQQPAKKDGHGGAFTWAGSDNGADGEFIPHDAGAEAAKLNVAAVVNKNDGDAADFALRSQDFPPLGGAKAAPDSPVYKL